MNEQQRQELIDAYVWRIVDNMSTKDLMVLAMDVIAAQYDEYADDELVGEISDNYPEILKEV